MKATKRFLSAIMAMAMVMVCGTAVSVSAEGDENANTSNVLENDGTPGWHGDMNGTGESEGNISMDHFDIVLPTTEINYIVDAQGLIKQSTANGSGRIKDKNTTIVYSTIDVFRYGAKEITDAKVNPISYEEDTTDPKKNNYVKKDGFVFFTTVAGGKTKMANYFDITIENKSSFGVDVTPAFTFIQDEDTGVNATYSTTAADGKLAFMLYKKTDDVVNEKKTGKKVFTPLDSSATVSVAGAASCYDVTYKEGDGYKYTINTNKYKAAKDLNNTLDFTLEGLASPTIDKDKTPGAIKIVWNFAKTPTT